MRITQDNIKIELENEEELKMAHKLSDLTEHKW